MGWFFRKKSCFGLEIKEQKIIMMDLAKTGNKYEIKNYGQVEVPEGYIEGSTVIHEEGVIQILQELNKSLGGAASKIAVAVSGDSIIARNLVLPNMPDNELGEAVKFETEAQIPVPGKDVTIDFVKYNSTSQENLKRLEIMAVAVKNEVIDQQVRIISSAGLQPAIMDVEPLTLLRTIKTLNPEGIPRDGSYAIINIGSSSTNISVFRGEQMFFTRTLGFGIYKLSHGLATHYNISLEEAELAVRQVAISSEVADQDNPLIQGDPLLIPKINGFVTEVRRSMDYYLAQNSGQGISRIFITGMGALINGLSDYMEINLGYPVSVFNPMEYLQISPRLKNAENIIIESGPALSQVVGLALSEAV